MPEEIKESVSSVEMIEEDTDNSKEIFPIKEKEKEHIQLLKELSVLCRSNKKGFTDKSRLKEIQNALSFTPYKLLMDGRNTHIYARPEAMEHENWIVISTHADTVSQITQMKSEYDETYGILTGTYDNVITNAVSVILMRETKLPPNVVFCFNADEETGRCNGAKEVVQCLNLLHRKAIYIALDVTYEAYHTNKLYTVENCSFLERNRKTFIQKLYDIDDAFSYVPVGKKDTKLSYVKPSERAFGISWFDEGAAYGKQRKNAFSLCIPCGDGEMHSNIGVKVQQPVFEGYINSLGCVIAKLARDNQLLETLKKERSYIKEQLRNLPEKPVRTFRYDYPEDDLYGQYSFMDCSEFGYVPFSSKDMEDYEEWRMQIKEYFTMQASMYETDEFENFLAELNVPEKYIGYFTDSGDMEHMDGEEYYEALMFLEECFADTHPEYQSDIDYDVLLEEIS